jgi:hypothetical protein
LERSWFKKEKQQEIAQQLLMSSKIDRMIIAAPENSPRFNLAI